MGRNHTICGRCRRLAATISLALVVAACGPPALPADDVTVTGDARLLQILLDAQLTNQTRFPFGRLHATVRDLAAGKECNLKLVWDGPLTYREYAERWIQGAGSQNVTRQVESPEEHWALNNGRLAFHRIGKRSTGGRLCDQRPTEGWYHVFRARNIPFSLFFDPSHPRFQSARFRDKAPQQWSVGEEAAGLIRVRMTGNGRWSGEILVSLLQGANVIMYQLQASSTKGRGFWFGSFDWAQDQEQRWYLSKASHGQRTLQPDEEAPQDPEPSLQVTVHEFDGSTRPPKSQFRKEALEIPDGIRLEVTHPDGRRESGIVGGPQAIVSNPHLNELLEQQSRQLQFSGFIGRTQQ